MKVSFEDMWNTLNPDEEAWTSRKAEADTARDEWRRLYIEAQKEWEKFVGEHTCRMKREDPFINDYNGAEIYPNHPTCLVCEEEDDMESYCPKSPSFMCFFKHESSSEPISSSKMIDEWEAGSYRSRPKEDQDLFKYTLCIYCGDTWDRSR